MPYCPDIAGTYTSLGQQQASNGGGLGYYSCTDTSIEGSDGSGDNSICCIDNTTKASSLETSIDGVWDCGEGTAGDPLYYGQGWTGGCNPDAFMCIRDEDSLSNQWVNGTSALICPESLTCQPSQSPSSAPSAAAPARRLQTNLNHRMEELFSSYQKHNSTVSLIQPQPEESDTKTKEVGGATDDEEQVPLCRLGVPIADVRRFDADRCNPLATPEQVPLEILSRSGRTVTFTLSQVWKQCDDGSSANKMDWIAVDFVVPESGTLECFKTSKPDCGNVNAFTAKCTEGRALIDIYALDETATGVFYQTDGSALTIPDACAAGDKKGDATKACKFRYILNCMEACEDDLERYSWWPIAYIRKLMGALRLG